MRPLLFEAWFVEVRAGVVRCPHIPPFLHRSLSPVHDLNCVSNSNDHHLLYHLLVAHLGIHLKMLALPAPGPPSRPFRQLLVEPEPPEPCALWPFRDPSRAAYCAVPPVFPGSASTRVHFTGVEDGDLLCPPAPLWLAITTSSEAEGAAQCQLVFKGSRSSSTPLCLANTIQCNRHFGMLYIICLFTPYKYLLYIFHRKRDGYPLERSGTFD